MGAGNCGHFRQGMEVAKQSPEKVEEAAVDHILEDRLPERRKVSWRGPGAGRSLLALE